MAMTRRIIVTAIVSVATLLAQTPAEQTELRNAADGGDATSQFKLGSIYAQGKVVPQDYAEAARWYRKAADQGLASAQVSLASMYYQGSGVPQNYAESIRWMR